MSTEKSTTPDVNSNYTSCKLWQIICYSMVPAVGNFFMIEPLTPWMVVYLFSAGALALVLFTLLYRRFDKSIEHEGRLAYVVKKAEVAYAQHRSRVSSRTRG